MEGILGILKRDKFGVTLALKEHYPIGVILTPLECWIGVGFTPKLALS